MIGERGYRRWRVWLLVVGGLLVAASALYAVVQLAHGGLDPSSTTSLLGLPVGVAALVVAVVAPRQLPDLAELARDLAEMVTVDEQRQWRQLIGNDTQRINLTFTLRPESGRTAEAPASAGHLVEGIPTFPDVAEYYRQTRPRRLVVTGEPGAGKTVLALELMLALIEGREEKDPVPVRLSLAEWDTTIPVPEWLVSHLVNVYEWPAKMARKLVRQRLVLPVLDGLDEMDPTAPDGTPLPDAPRAKAAMEVLNAYQDGRAAGPVILTCRTRHYEAMDRRVRLLDAARIDIDPITPLTARTYLRQRAHDPARWQPVLEALDQDPAGTLSTTLSTPWRLCLAATVYARDGDPAELLRHATRGDLDEYLLARFVPAATALHPCRRPPYAEADVHRWLARLAAHLDIESPVPGAGAGTSPRADLVLHQLWPLAGHRRVRATDAVLTTLTVMLPLPLAWASSDTLAVVEVVAMVAVVAGLLAAVASVRPPTHVHWRRLRTRAGCRDVALGLVLGLVAGLSLALVLGVVWGLTFGLGAGIALGLVLAIGGIVLGLAIGLTRAIGREPPTRAQPRDVIRGDFLRGLVSGLTIGAVFVLGAGVVAKFSVVVPAGLALVLAWGLAVGAPSGRRYLVFLLCSRGELPWRLGLFLDCARTAGLLRFAGAAYQFRHRELQQWLARHPSPPPM